MEIVSEYTELELIFDKLRRHRITVSQISLMLFLRRLNNDWIRMKNLSEQYNQPHYVISKMIKRLRKHDFIEEKKDIDGRFVLLKLNKRAFNFLDTTFNI